MLPTALISPAVNMLPPTTLPDARTTSTPVMLPPVMVISPAVPTVVTLATVTLPVALTLPAVLMLPPTDTVPVVLILPMLAMPMLALPATVNKFESGSKVKLALAPNILPVLLN